MVAISLGSPVSYEKHQTSGLSAERDFETRPGTVPGAKDDNTPPKWSRAFSVRAHSPARLLSSSPFQRGEAAKVNFCAATAKSGTGRHSLTSCLTYLPIFPAHVRANAKSRAKFLHKLVDDAPIELQPDKTGFVDADTFVTHCEVRAQTAAARPFPTSNAARQMPFIDIKGTLEGTTELVLKLANEVDLSCIRHRRRARRASAELRERSPDQRSMTSGRVRETADFNFSGTSSSGKSSICLAALSLAGSPDRAGTLDFSKRGLAEMASDSNDLTLVLDDTEKADEETLSTP